MKNFGICIAATISISMLMNGTALGQLFGERTVGRSIQRRVGPGATIDQSDATGATVQAGGTITGSERFLRGNRAPREFVGRDVNDRETFIGQQQGQATGNVRSAAEDVRPTRRFNANLVPTPLEGPGGIYPAQLAIAFAFELAPSDTQSAELTDVLNSSRGIQRLEGLQVIVRQRVAHLHGSVATERDRDLAEAMIRFEPGVDRIVNELQVVAGENELPPPPTPSSNPARKSP